MNPEGSILLVEDDEDDRRVALRALRRAGLEDSVAVAHNGREALEVLGLEPGSAQPARRPSVVFLDLKMPGVDGWEILDRMRDEPCTAVIPVVVLSSSDRSDDVQRSYELGANSFLVKHLDPRSPGTYIAEAAQYWLDLNRPPPRRVATGNGPREDARE
ncbi:MAG: response regulator [Myxococcota bacterium]